MIDRNEMVVEQLLRENIRKAINIVKKRHIKSEEYLRTIVRSLLKEETTTGKYEYNALNQLGHLMDHSFGSTSSKKSKSKFAFKEAFIDLVSNEEDREIFVNFILDFSNETMSDIDSGKELEKVEKEKEEKPPEKEYSPADDEDDDIIRVSIEDIPGGDLEAYVPEEEEEILSLGEDAEGAEGAEIEEEHPELKKYAEKAYSSIEPFLEDYYTNYVNRMIEDDVVLDTSENIFLPQSEKRQEVFKGGTLTERDLFKIFYKINVLSWAGRYNNEYFNENPVTNSEIVPPGEEVLGMSSDPGVEIPGGGLDL